MMRKLFFLALLISMASYCLAQKQIKQYEYWFDDNYTAKIEVNTSSSPTCQLSTTVPTLSLAAGLHTFQIRFKDNTGLWSSSANQFFIKIPSYTNQHHQIAKYEYWFDNDNAHSISQSVVAQDSISLLSSVNTNTLASGLHTFQMRFQDNSGLWSSSTSQFFIKISNYANQHHQISKYEYWFDNDNTHSISQSVVAQYSISLLSSINTNTLASGLHTFQMRFQDNTGLWSSSASQFFIKIPNYANQHHQISKYEYWFDNDNAHLISQTVTAQDSISLFTSISTNTLPSGLHTFQIRFKDNTGLWSSSTSQFFIKIPGTTGQHHLITKYEYWFDNDNAHLISQTVTAQDSISMLTSIITGNLPKGLHTFQIRFQDNTGLWSSSTSQFFIKPIISDTNNKIMAYRYWFDTGSDSLMVNINIAPSTNPLFLLTQINCLQLNTGIHAIHFQFRDLLNNWSSVITDTISYIGKPRLESISPDNGGNVGDVTATIKGAFYNINCIKLTKSGQADIIVPDSLIQLNNYSTIITINLNLRNKAIGNWNLVVSTLDTIMQLNNAFKIDSGIVKQPWSEIVGFQTIRPGQWQTYTVKYGNDGNVDAVGVPLWIAISSNMDISYDFKISNPPDTLFNNFSFGIPLDTIISKLDTMPDFVVVDTLFSKPDNSKVLALLLPIIPSKYSGYINIKLKVNNFSSSKIKTWTSKPLYRSPLNGDAIDCVAGIISNIVTPLLGPEIGCIYGLSDVIIRPYIGAAAINLSSWNNWNGGNPGLDYFLEKYKLSNFKKDLFLAGMGCLGNFKEYKEYAKITSKLLTDVNYLNATSSCLNFFLPLVNPQDFSITPIISRDPNDKTGPKSNSSQNYLHGNKDANYLISFENDSTATASAQVITIIDTLDMNIFDFNTFQFGYIKVGNHMINIPSNNKNYSMLYDLRPYNNDLIIDVKASLNDTTGVLKWTLTSLDPSTMQPTINPIAGILPPNINSPEGEGAVLYSIKIRDSLTLGVLVKNRAYIYFDLNSPIVTPTWTNIMDNTKPISSVNPLSTYTTSDSIYLQWHGVDVGSGIYSYSIYSAVNGGAYSLWENTHDTSTIYIGAIDSTYRFYSIATDSAGNIETAPLNYDAKTTLCGIPAKAALPMGLQNICADTNTNYSTNSIHATKYQWSVYPLSAGYTNDTSSSANIHWNKTFSGFAHIFVKGSNACSTGVYSDTLTINVKPLPVTATQIVGPISICQGQINVNYSIPQIANATNYIWTLPNGTIDTTNSDTNIVNFINNMPSGNIIVRGYNNCGKGDSSYIFTVVNPSYNNNINNTICQGDSIIVGMHIYKTTGNYIDHLTTKLGCDSIINTNLIVHPSYNNQNIFSICQGDSIIVGMHIYKTTGNYIDHLTTLLGCDSIISTNLTVKPIFNIQNNNTICQGDSIVVGSHIYKITGIYTNHLSTVLGCDSIITSNITVHPSYNILVSRTICQGDSIVVGSHPYLSTGNYLDSLTTLLGCDSIITTNLTVNPSYNILVNRTICQGDSVVVGVNTYTTSGNYIDHLATSLSCDSIITTKLIVNPSYNMQINRSICNGDSIIVGANIYKITGNYFDHLITKLGCDSIISTDLIVNSIPPIPIIQRSGNSLYSDVTLGNQWYNILYGKIDSAISQTYIPQQNGNYFVIVTLNGCSSDSSNIIYYDGKSTIKVYPNPVSNELIIEAIGTVGTINFEIFNTVGKSVYLGTLTQKTTIQTSSFALGIYIIKLDNGKILEFKKIVKE